ncbi:MAG: flagellar biosynthesis protein FlhF [Kiritimatiellia bacterium]
MENAVRVERFQEDDMRQAMAKVRSVLGKDAVLISSKNVDSKVEVIAASDYEPENLAAQLQKLDQEQAQAQALVADDHPQIDHVWEVVGDDSAMPSKPPSSLADMQLELGQLRRLFEGELANHSWQEGSKRQPNRQALLTRLEAAGLARDISNKIVRRALPCNDLELGWKRIQKILGLVIKSSETDVLNNGGIIALLGSTGVGKTATAAKIAAQFAIKHGRNQVAFITTDRNRVGDEAKLLSLGSALGIPVQVVDSYQQIPAALESLAVRKLVIIDAEGISQRDAATIEKIKTLLNDNQQIDPYLVIPATAQESVITETLAAYSEVQLTGAILTKVDEVASIGPAISGLIRNKLPIALMGNGQRIPEDLHSPPAEYFVNKLVESYLIPSVQSSHSGFVQSVRHVMNG